MQKLPLTQPHCASTSSILIDLLAQHAPCADISPEENLPAALGNQQVSLDAGSCGVQLPFCFTCARAVLNSCEWKPYPSHKPASW